MRINATQQMLKDGWVISDEGLYTTNKQGVNCTISIIGDSSIEVQYYVLVTDSAIKRQGNRFFGVHTARRDLHSLVQIANKLESGAKPRVRK